ncbi:MAG: MurR/RpiR family transcriptional regulator [Firmicutes bacterium]|nr:MurR/RpiR family transcriptional regulator [Bacillota bacterium]
MPRGRISTEDILAEAAEKTVRARPLLARIPSHLAGLTGSERKVAQVVIRQPQQVVYSSVTELAALAEVGETTVLRFARKLGYRNYQDFKMDLARDVFSEPSANGIGMLAGESAAGGPAHQGGEAVPGQGGAAEAGTVDVLAKATERNQRVIMDTFRVLDRAAFNRAVQILAGAHHIHFYGVGHSGITAHDAHYRFLRLGFPVSSFSDPHFQTMAAATLAEGDAAVGLSVSGSTKDTVECLQIARRHGAKTIAITGYAQAPIVREADVVLLTATRESPLESGSFTSKIGQLHMLDLLCVALVGLHPDAVRRQQENVAEAISSKLF